MTPLPRNGSRTTRRDRHPGAARPAGPRRRPALLRQGSQIQPGPLFDWLSSGDVPLDESGVLKVSQTSYDYTRPYWDQIGATIVGRHVFDLTDGWEGKPPAGVDHVVVVTHRSEPEGWDHEAPFNFVNGVEATVAKAQELAGDRMVEVAAGDVGGRLGQLRCAGQAHDRQRARARSRDAQRDRAAASASPG